MTSISEFEIINDKKANFDEIYHQADPREYFRVLCGLDYVIPDLAKDIVRSLIAATRRQANRPIKVLDLGCSYGVNTALTKYPLDIRRLAQRYVAKEMQALDSKTLATLDARYFESWPVQTDTTFVGLDASRPAVEYALLAGLLDAAVCANFERDEPDARAANLLRHVDLIVSTGCIGYMTERSLRHVLNLQQKGSTPWIANFVLRMFPYGAIARELQEFGLVTEKLEGVTFVQRRFHSENEFRSTLSTLEKLGIDATGKETDGLLHAELYVSRPAESIANLPLADIISVTSGAGRRYGRRFSRISPQIAKLLH